MEMPLLISANLFRNLSALSQSSFTVKNLFSEMLVKSKTFGDRAFEEKNGTKIYEKSNVLPSKTIDPTLVNLNPC